MKGLVLVLALVALAVAVPRPFHHGDWQGDTVVLISVFRHGVRSPDDPPPSDGRDITITNFTTKEFPPWTDGSSSHPAGKGGVTENGEKVLELFGEWFKEFYSVGSNCASISNSSYVYVDVSGRCQQSATSFWHGYAPGCAIPTTVQPPTSDDKNVYPGRTLFKHYTDQFDLPNCHGNTNSTIGGGNITRRQEWMINLYKDEIKGINYILGDNFDSGLCDFSESRISRATNCNLFGIPIEAPDWADSSYFRGPMGYANYWANYFLTQYYDGQDVGFGYLTTKKDDFGQTRRIARVHYAQDFWQNLSPSAAFSFTSELLAHILTSIEQAASGQNVNVDSINHPYYKTFLTYFGHHENVSLLLALLQVQMASEQNDYAWIPFSGGLQFRLYKAIDPDTNLPNLFISLYFIVPTPDQHRHMEVLNENNPPSFEQIQMAWCTDSSSYFCRYEDFKHYILTAFKNTCVYDETLVNFMKKQRAMALFGDSVSRF